jgi:thioredoxin reductase
MPASHTQNIAVVGGGIFGVTAAVRFARAGYCVQLFEKAPTLLSAASAINQFRLHRGSIVGITILEVPRPFKRCETQQSDLLTHMAQRLLMMAVRTSMALPQKEVLLRHLRICNFVIRIICPTRN